MAAAVTPHQKGLQVRFWFPAKIPAPYENISQNLFHNLKPQTLQYETRRKCPFGTCGVNVSSFNFFNFSLKLHTSNDKPEKTDRVKCSLRPDGFAAGKNNWQFCLFAPVPSSLQTEERHLQDAGRKDDLVLGGRVVGVDLY